ncbi:hypothetical protein MTO96_003800 [Rhipicephalus appendiculatus]
MKQEPPAGFARPLLSLTRRTLQVYREGRTFKGFQRRPSSLRYPCRFKATTPSCRLRTYERKENRKNWAIIQNTASRNSAFLERAARLVSDLSNNIVDAEDLALVASSPLLPLLVSELAAVCECQAASMIGGTIRKLRDIEAVPGISAIDWDSVGCAYSSECQTRLDTLPADYGLGIR